MNPSGVDEVSTYDPQDAEKALEQLRLCQLELADLREQQEQWAEQLGRARRRARRFEQQSQSLARALVEELRAKRKTHVRRSLARRLTGRATTPSVRELAMLRLIESSDLFWPAWYLRQNLEVAQAGMDPALHFLRHGAREGFDPSPKFNTKDYVEAHPEVLATGDNPLVHYLHSKERPAG